MRYAEKRKQLVDWLRFCLMGPCSQQGDLNGIQPIDRFHTGVLFPIVKGEGGIDPAFEDQADDDENSGQAEMAGNGDGAEPAGKRRRYVPPSSVGFSFFIRGGRIALQVQAYGVRYRKTRERDEAGRFVTKEWQRIELCPPDGETQNIVSPKAGQGSRERISVFEGRGEVYLLWRPYADGWITTISLCNSAEVRFDNPLSWKLARNERSLFEVRLKCVIDSGEVGTYPRVDKSLLTDEEQELELQYKHRHIYAIGHGAAADWKLDGNGRVAEIFADFMPAVEVPQVTTEIEGVDETILELQDLSGCTDRGNDGIFADLDRFVAVYEDWVAGRQHMAGNFAEDAYERAAAARIVKRMQSAVSRMKQGIAILRKNSLAARAFQIANLAMFRQMVQSDRVRGQGKASTRYRWRPFQLAFLLMAIESITNEDSEFRDTVDLIWFPTGGGKTEAYLGLIAFQIAWRRLTNPKSGGGTTVLMRYTLRLLTAQQYMRATRMICALELIRQTRSDLGTEPITAGMWVGEAISPNNFATARKIVAKAAQGTGIPPRKLVLDCCPWCAAPFKAPDNYETTPSRFAFRCTEVSCEFGRSGMGTLPCNVVDEAMYESPPTLLMATIDKFARLAWDERATAFFGKNGNRPPELIIQDELHLIAGALGSVAGLYEAALDTVLTRRGVHPKYIASTATIRMADQQVRRLYGRDLSVFPPPGLSCDDSFFARTVPTHVRPGRLYVGYLAPMLDRQHCMAPLAAALLAGPEIVFRVGEKDRDLWLDAWWTQVIYHGSLKGVGNSHNAFYIDVPAYFKRYAQEAEETNRQNRQEEISNAPIVNRPPPRLAQLTSISTAQENAGTFSRLERSHGEAGCLDAVLATNMISVGLDVARLALMVVNGQPLTTAEYIQAGSRVGRGEVPGLVFANYYRDQARSLSHYECFRPYHESFYRFVEPTSITPYTYQTRLRALHAALVIAMRHSCPTLLPNDGAGGFDPTDDAVRKVAETLKRRCERADPERMEAVNGHMDRLMAEWHLEAARCREFKIRLDYQAPDKDKATDRLLYNHGDKIKGLWPTLQSMRNVENTALLRPS